MPAIASTTPAERGPPVECGADASRCVLGFASVDELKAWVRAFPGRAGLAVVFGDTTSTTLPDGSSAAAQAVTDALPSSDMRYEIWYNNSALQYGWYAKVDGADALGVGHCTLQHVQVLLDGQHIAYPGDVGTRGFPALYQFGGNRISHGREDHGHVTGCSGNGLCGRCGNGHDYIRVFTHKLAGNLRGNG